MDKTGLYLANVRSNAVSTSEKVAIYNVQRDALPTTSAFPAVSESGVGSDHSMNDDERTSFSPEAAPARVTKLPNNNEESAAVGERSLPVAQVLLL